VNEPALAPLVSDATLLYEDAPGASAYRSTLANPAIALAVYDTDQLVLLLYAGELADDDGAAVESTVVASGLAGADSTLPALSVATV
jgi:hypothetical protein